MVSQEDVEMIGCLWLINAEHYGVPNGTKAMHNLAIIFLITLSCYL